MRQTNPILPLRISDCGLRIEDGPAAGRPLRLAGSGACCTNKPSSPERIVRNKPNLRARRGVGRARPTLQGAQVRQTNPIPPSQPGPWERKRAKQTQFAPARRSQWGRPHPTRGCQCAKQTQFGPVGRIPGRGNVRNKPNLAGWPSARNKANLHRTTYLLFHYSSIPTGTGCTNKANSPLIYDIDSRRMVVTPPWRVAAGCA